jgi:hypothetical protein
LLRAPVRLAPRSNQGAKPVLITILIILAIIALLLFIFGRGRMGRA